MNNTMLSWLLWLLLVGPLPAYALEPYIEAGAGAALFQITVPDGTWYQEAFPHTFKTTDLALRAGVGVQVAEHWGVSVAYTRLGAVQSDADFVWDANYSPSLKRCISGCERVNHLSATDRMQGPELTVRREFAVGALTPFLKMGGAWMFHSITVPAYTDTGRDISIAFKGVVPMVVLGGGVCYIWVCGEVSYYKGIGSTGFPLAKDAVVPMLTVRISL